MVIRIVIFLIVIFCASCSSAQKVSDRDFYKIVNLMLNKAKEKRDSVHVISWKSDKFYMNSERTYNSDNFSVLNFKKKRGEKVFLLFKDFLNEYKIDIDREIPFFKRQLKKPFGLDKEKINLKELKIFPPDSDWYSIKYNMNFTNYYYVLSKPLITRDGMKAIYYQGGSDYANFFIVLTKENKEWREVGRFNTNKIVID